MLPTLAKKQELSKKLSQQVFETKTPFQGKAVNYAFLWP